MWFWLQETQLSCPWRIGSILPHGGSILTLKYALPPHPSLIHNHTQALLTHTYTQTLALLDIEPYTYSGMPILYLRPLHYKLTYDGKTYVLCRSEGFNNSWIGVFNLGVNFRCKVIILMHMILHVLKIYINEPAKNK